MRILGNCPLVLTRKWLSSAPLMLLVATFVLPSAQAQDKGAQPSVGPTPAGVADASLPKQPDAWGPDRDGLRTRLLPAQEEYVIGRPAKFRLEMQNFGERERSI